MHPALQACGRTQPELTCIAVICASVAHLHPAVGAMALADAEAAAQMLPETAVELLTGQQQQQQQASVQDAQAGLLQLLRSSSGHMDLLKGLTASCCRAGLLDSKALTGL